VSNYDHNKDGPNVLYIDHFYNLLFWINLIYAQIYYNIINLPLILHL